MYVLRVGQLYNPKRTSWPEGTQYAFRCGTHELLLFFHGPTTAEVEAVRRGRAQFALYAQGDLLVLCSQFGDQPWTDAPFSWHLLPESEREEPPELTRDERIALQVILVDAATGIVQVLRLKTLSPGFSRALHRAIRAQRDRPWPGQPTYDARLDAVFAEYRTVDLVEKALAVDSGEDGS